MQVLTDTYGRILTQYTQDGDYRTACVYVTGDGRLDWDDASEPELISLLSKYGYNDALTIEDNDVTINDNGDTETLIWDSAAMDFTVDVDLFQNGEQNMFFRTVNDGSRDVTVLVDADGKAITTPTLGEYTGVLFSVANNGTEIDTITEGSSISREGIINACGGSFNVTALDAGASVFLLVMGTHVQYCNADDLTTTPVIPQIIAVQIYADSHLSSRPTGKPDSVIAVVRVPLDESKWIPDNDGDYLRISKPIVEEGETDFSLDWAVDYRYSIEGVVIPPGIYQLNRMGSVPDDVDNIPVEFYFP